jgi:hypothetical protein
VNDVDGDLFGGSGEHDFVDLNDDGVVDAEIFAVDTNLDGVLDAEIGAIDSDGDGIVDTTYAVVDVDGDGTVDAAAIDLDVDGDAVADAVVMLGDVDGDAVLDLAVDANADGHVDVFAVGDEAKAIWGDLAAGDVDGVVASLSEHADATPTDSEDCFDALACTHEDLAFEGHDEFYELHGTPVEDMELWDQQDAPFSCAVATTNMMYRSFGVDFGEDALAEAFQQLGIYDPAAGSDVHEIDDAINLIAETQGIDAHAVTVNAQSVDDFAALLDAGFKPMVAIDTYELEYGGVERCLNDAGLLPGAGHAVQLTGIESTPDGTYAILNDPDRGAGIRVPFDVFLDASEDFSGACVVMGNTEMLAVFNPSAAASASPTLLGNRVPLMIDPLTRNVYQGDSLFPLT